MKRLPAGFGSVSKLADAKHRYKPYRAILTIGYEIGKDGKAKQKRKLLGTFKTRSEAIQALTDYNKEPYDVRIRKITFEQLYNEWYPTCKRETMKSFDLVFPKMVDLHQVPFYDIRLQHLEDCVKKLTPNSQREAKSLLRHLYNYAKKHDIVEKDYSEYLEIEKRERTTERTVFTNDEIKYLWDHQGDKYIDFLLISLYSGWRTMEALEVKFDIDAKTMHGGSKTEAGRNRTVPIHSKIMHLAERYKDGFNISYNMLVVNLRIMFKQLGWKHVAYETRHTFVTRMKQLDTDEYLLKIIIGHQITDVTEAYYTHRTVEELRPVIEKLNYSEQ